MRHLTAFSLVLALAVASLGAQAGGARDDFPPIPEGYYAFGMSCQQAIAEGKDGDPPVNLVRFERNRFQEVDGGRSVTGIRNMGNGVWRVLAAIGGVMARQ